MLQKHLSTNVLLGYRRAPHPLVSGLRILQLVGLYVRPAINFLDYVQYESVYVFSETSMSVAPTHDGELMSGRARQASMPVLIAPSWARGIVPARHLSEGRHKITGSTWLAQKDWKACTSSTLCLKDRFVFSLATNDCANFQTYINDVYLFLKELVEKVAKLHIPALNMELTVLTQSQLGYSGVKVEGPANFPLWSSCY